MAISVFIIFGIISVHDEIDLNNLEKDIIVHSHTYSPLSKEKKIKPEIKAIVIKCFPDVRNNLSIAITPFFISSISLNTVVSSTILRL